MAILTTTDQGLNFTGGSALIKTGTSTVMSLTTSSDVGIGTTAPSEKLHVDGTGQFGDYLKIGTNVNAGYYQDSSNGAYRATGTSGNRGYWFQGYGGSGTTMYIGLVGAYASNVGIGTNTPSYKLQVHGGQYGTYLKGGDLGTGSDVVRMVKSDNSVAMLVRGDGNVGIGTTNPVQKLQVNGSVYSAGGEFYVNDNSGITAVGNLIFKGHNGSSYFEGMRLTSSGNVGIGTTNPSQKLDVVVSDVNVTPNSESSAVFRRNGNNYLTILTGSTSQGGILFGNAADANDGSISYTQSTQKMAFGTADTTRMVINSSGDVGIGTTNPNVKLHVEGDPNTAGVLGRFYGSATHGALLQFHRGASYNWLAGIGGGSASAGLPSSYFGIVENGNTPRLVIAHSTGNVGIGTVFPDSLLEIANTPAAQSQTRMLHIDNNPVGNQGSGYIQISSGTNSQATTQIEQVSSGGYGLLGNKYFDTNIINKGLSASAWGNINFATGSSTSATSIVMTIGGGSQKGNVGIGTTSPAYKLDVAGNARIGSSSQTTTSLYLTATNTAGSPAMAVQTIMQGYEGRGLGTFYTDTAYSGKEWFNGINYSGGFVRWSVGYDETGGQAEYLANAKFTVYNNGNVGIGTTNPDSKLDVTGGNITVNTSGITFADFKYGSIGSETSRGTITTDGIDLRINATADLVLLPTGNVGIGTANPTARLHLEGDSIIEGVIRGDNVNLGLGGAIKIKASNSASDQYVAFGTTPSGSSGSATFTEKMRINSSGNVGIGATDPDQKLDVNGNIRIPNQGKIVFGSAGTATDYLQLHDVAAGNPLLKLVQDNVERFSIEGVTGNVYMQGSVGIGITNPQAKLDVKGGMSAFETTLTNSNDWENSAISILERDNVGSAQSADKYSPNLNFHWSARVSNSLWMNSSGHLNWGSFGSNGIPNADGVFQTNTINLIGTGRITGVDTVSASTDAANKAYVDAQVGSADTLQEVTDNGNTTTNSIGIGTTSPNGKLDVRQTANSGRTLVLGNTAASVAGDIDGQIVFTKHPAFYDSWKLYSKNTNAGNGQADLYLDSYATTSTFKNNVTFLNNGNVGIGTTSPQQLLHVNGEAQFGPTSYQGDMNGGKADLSVDCGGTSQTTWVSNYFQVGGTDLNWSMRAYAGFLQTYNQDLTIKAGGTGTTSKLFLGTNGQTQTITCNNGNVGIGTTSPNDQDLSINAPKLHVVGPSTTGAFNLVARFQGGNDNDNTGAAILINHSNDRGLLINAGRADSDREVAYFNLVSSGAVVTNMLTLRKVGSAYNVGIGTDSPSVKLEVVGGSENILKLKNTGGQPALVRFNDTSTTADPYIGSYGNDLAFGIYGVGESIRITSSRNVGIGTTNPSEVLQVEGTARMNNGITEGTHYIGDGLQHWGDGGTGLLFPSNDVIDLQTTSTSRIRIDSSGNVGIGTTSPATKLDVDGLISSDQISSKKYTSLTGSSNDWFPIGSINEHQTGPVLFQVITAYHSNMSFIVAKGYSTSQVHTITLLSSIDGNNTGYANIKGVRVRQDGQVEIQLYWATGPSVLVNITARSTTDPVSLPSSLATSTSSENVIDTVTNENGKLRSRKLITTSSNVRLSDNGVSYLNGGNVGIGTVSPQRNLEIKAVGTADSIIRLSAAGNSTYYSDIINSVNSTRGFAIQSQGVDALTIAGSGGYSGITIGNVNTNLKIKPFSGDFIFTGGNVGIGTTSPSNTLDIAGGLEVNGEAYIRSTNNVGLRIQNTNKGITASDGLRVGLNDSHAFVWQYENLPLAFATNGSQKATILANGNFGIGTVSPSAKLDVVGDAEISGDLDLTGGQLEMRGDVALDHDGQSLYVKAPSSIFFYAGNSNKGNIASSGNMTLVGGLTVSGGNSTNWNTAYTYSQVGHLPLAGGTMTGTLDVNGSSSVLLRVKGGARIALENSSANDSFYISNTGGSGASILDLGGTVTIIEGGNVGIGTTSAGTYKLNVVGGGRFSAYVDFANNFGIRGIKTDNSAIVIARINSSNELVINENASTTVPTRIIGNHIALETTNFLGTAVEAVRVIDGGNVGIGTTSPATKLDVVGDLTVSGNQYFNGEYIYGDSKRMFKYSDTWLRINAWGEFTSGIYCGTGILRTDGIFQIGAGGSKFIVTAAGDVGIGVSSSPSSKLQVNGTITATTKNFLIDNPKTGGELQYSVIESDEHGVCVRGESDQEEIELPEEWEWLVHEDSVTVQLTSIDQVQHLFVLERNNIRVRVGGLVTNGQYSYVVYGTRKDVDPLEVNI
jgi:hypothetical protein